MTTGNGMETRPDGGLTEQATASGGDKDGIPDGAVYRESFRKLPMSMALLDSAGRIVAVNERWRQFACANGGDPEGYIGASYVAACRDADDTELAEIERLFRELVAGERDLAELEYPCHSPDERRWFLMQAYRYAEGDDPRIAVLHIDITQRRLAEEAARHRAATDSLTGLLTREEFTDRAAQILAIAAREQLNAAVVFLDLDGYKAINDHYGHETGDRVLAAAAERLRSQTRESDLLARYGGDELVVIAEGADRAAAECLSERLRAIIGAPLTVDGHDFELTCSQGIALYPDHGGDLATLLSAADTAMYRAKASGPGNVVHYA